MLKNIFEILSNPLLYYVDKSGNSVFRNYCLFKNTGCLYSTTLPKKNAGKTLEYRFDLDKYLKRTYFLTPVILYFIFIHTQVTLLNVLFFELLWILIVNGARIACSYIYSRHLTRTFGKYDVVEFRPPVSKSKLKEYQNLYWGKFVALVIVLALLFLPSFALEYAMKQSIVSKHKFGLAIKISKIYLSFYPKKENIYDMRACAKYMEHDYEGALEDYKTVLDLSGRKFTKKDLARLGNMLYLEKVLKSPNEALDLYNEYSTKKAVSVLESSQLLWLKSLFQIENNMYDSVISEYNEIINSLNKNDVKNWFYISSDKAYILYLMKEYNAAIEVYDEIISYAKEEKTFSKELPVLYAERGFAKRQAGDIKGADDDFLSSGITPWDMAQHEPSFASQEFVLEQF